MESNFEYEVERKQTQPYWFILANQCVLCVREEK